MRSLHVIFLNLTLVSATTAQFSIDGINPEFSYISDLAFNSRGGIQKGISHMGQVDFVIDFLTEDLKLWKGGNLQFNYLITHGGPLSGLMGDLQVASNIEAPPTATFFELWYRQEFKRHTFMAGLIDLNTEFLYNDHALSLLNSSFGIQPTLSVNMPLSIFPLSSLGIIYHFNLPSGVRISSGIFDGRPSMNRQYQIIPDLVIKQHEGLFVIQELGMKYGKASNTGELKIGGWIHTADFDSHDHGYYSGNMGIYLLADQKIGSLSSGKIYGWVKGGMAPRSCNIVKYFGGGGVSWTDPLDFHDQDVLSAGIGHAHFFNHPDDELRSEKNETVFEITYMKNFEFLTIQPDLQYILNPSGRADIKNPLCFIVRASINIPDAGEVN